MLAKRLRAARSAKKWTQEQLGKKVNTTKGTISNYENGHSTPSNEMLLLLASVLDTTTDYLLGSSVEGKQSIYGKEVDVDELTEKQRIVLEWALNQEALSFHSKDEIYKILDRLSVVMEYERAKSEEDGNN